MIYTVTLNPAIDRILYVDRFKRNETVRIQNVVETIGGKGTHVSINLELMGETNCAIIAVHGVTGRRVIDSMLGYGVEVQSYYKEHPETRTNYLIAEGNGASTLITDKGALLSAYDIDQIITIILSKVQERDYLILSGDASNYSDPYVYSYILDRLKCKKPRVFLDSSGESMKKCLEKSPFLIKPNLAELSTICGCRIEADVKAVIRAIDKFLDSYSIDVVAVSMGSEGSVVKFYDEYYRAVPPQVTAVNTVGCGDCYLAGMIRGFAKGDSFSDILRYATAVSAAAAESELSAGFNYERSLRLMEQVSIERVYPGGME